MNTIVFHPVLLSEISLIQELQKLASDIFRATFSHTVSADIMDDYLHSNFSVAQLENELTNPESYFYLVGNTDCWFGYIKLNSGSAQTEDRPDTHLEIQRFYLQSDYHGKGIAQQMMHFCESFARQKQANRLWLGVAEDNIPALKFYLKEGFQKTGSHPFDFAGKLEYDWCVEKELD
jgi:ribosomal protein S18 acetylase RimI-like enzyme